MLYYYDENLADILDALSALLGGGIMPLVNIAIYVFTALSLHTIARRRGIACPWLAWIPVANLWLLGSLSDQFRYLTQGKVNAKRVWLLVLEIVAAAPGIVAVVLAVMMVFMPQRIAGYLLALVLCALIALVLHIVRVVLGYVALRDVYASCDPENATLYLVLSILFGFLKPIFLFLCRNQDKGMPPRRNPEVENF